MTQQKVLNLNQKKIGAGHATFIIAEIGQAHDGSLGAAHAYIDAVAKAGVDAVKFQTHIASAESSILETFRVKGFPQDATRYDYWKRMEFTPEQWRGLVEHAAEKGLIFLSTPFSFEAVDLLNSLDICAWKIGSGEASNIPMIEYIAETKKPILLSTGLSSWREIKEVTDMLTTSKTPFGIFQCTSSYPCKPDEVGLNVIEELLNKYDCPIGLSDHSGSVYPSLAAFVMGARMLELHAVFSRDCFGPDVVASVTIEELSGLVSGIRQIEEILLNPIEKDEEAEKRKELGILFGKSLYAKSAIRKGQVLTGQDVTLKKPGSGIPAKKLKEVMGLKFRRDYLPGEQIQEEDLASD